jgi:hypothetical protein
MKSTIICAVALMFLVMSCGEREIYLTPVYILDLLQDDNEIDGWIKTESTRYAETADQLTSIIDGEAVPYIDNGFRAAVFQKYEGLINNNLVPVNVRIFDMGDTINAKNVYDDVETPGDSAWVGNNPGREARINVSFLFSYQIDFWADSFFIRIIIDDKSNDGLGIAKDFAFNISDAINTSELATAGYYSVMLLRERPFYLTANSLCKPLRSI